MKEETNANEMIICESKTHWIVLITPSVVAIILFMVGGFGLTGTKNKETAVGLLIIAVAIFAISYLNFKTNKLILTNKRIYGKTGIFNIRSLSSPVNKIQTVNIETPLFGRLVGYSNLTIHCITGVYDFKNQSNAKELQREIINLIQ